MLEIEEVEDLKDKLNKHLLEIKKLLSSSNNNDDDDEAELDRMDDAELRNRRLIDQIARLKDIIEDNRRVLEGDDINTDNQKDQSKENLELKKKRELED